jgi:hypothetical protein
MLLKFVRTAQESKEKRKTWVSPYISEGCDTLITNKNAHAVT